MALRVCLACACAYAVGLAACPQCGSPDSRADYEGDGMHKISTVAGPTLHPGTGVPMTGIGHPADGTWSPPVSNGDGDGVRAAVAVVPAGDGEPPAPEAGPAPEPKPAPARVPRKAADG